MSPNDRRRFPTCPSSSRETRVPRTSSPRSARGAARFARAGLRRRRRSPPRGLTGPGRRKWSRRSPRPESRPRAPRRSRRSATGRSRLLSTRLRTRGSGPHTPARASPRLGSGSREPRGHPGRVHGDEDSAASAPDAPVSRGSGNRRAAAGGRGAGARGRARVRSRPDPTRWRRGRAEAGRARRSDRATPRAARRSSRQGCRFREHRGHPGRVHGNEDSAAAAPDASVSQGSGNQWAAGRAAVPDRRADGARGRTGPRPRPDSARWSRRGAGGDSPEKVCATRAQIPGVCGAHGRGPRGANPRDPHAPREPEAACTPCEPERCASGSCG